MMHTLAPSASDLLFARASRHSRLVRFLRIFLVLSVISLSCLFVVRALLGLALFSPLPFGDISLESGKLVMDSPQISGYTGDSPKRYYDVRASRAIEDVTNPGFVVLQNIDAEFRDTPEGNIHLRSSGGIFDVSRERLTLNDAVSITSGRGIVMTLDNAILDVRSGDLHSDSPVVVRMDSHELTSGSVRITSHGSSITFGGGVHMTLDSSLIAR